MFERFDNWLVNQKCSCHRGTELQQKFCKNSAPTIHCTKELFKFKFYRVQRQVEKVASRFPSVYFVRRIFLCDGQSTEVQICLISSNKLKTITMEVSVTPVSYVEGGMFQILKEFLWGSR